MHFFLKPRHFPGNPFLNSCPGSGSVNYFISLPSEKIAALQTLAKTVDERYHAPDLRSYYALDCPSASVDTKKIVNFLRKLDAVDKAYVETGPLMPPAPAVAAMHPYTAQGHLQAAPSGISAVSTGSIKGANGEGQVQFVDIEQGWILDHESYHINTIPSTGMNHPEFRDHGAAVLGILLMQRPNTSLRGIVPAAKGIPISQWRADGTFNTADALLAALGELQFGDIILLEAQMPDSPNGHDVWPAEIQEAVFDLIRLATALGITVIEPSGNGQRWFGRGNDLDSYTNEEGRKIFDLSGPDFRDSGAILVAAGTSREPHKRMGYSNYGRRIDCFAWGENVVTAGSYPGSSREYTNLYTGKFAGTSSAAAIIAGAAISIQSIVEANLGFRLSPNQMRTILSSDLLGTASANGRINDKIGTMPDLKKIIEYIEKHAREPEAMNKIGIGTQGPSNWPFEEDQ